jgi:hypothetical protein
MNSSPRDRVAQFVLMHPRSHWKDHRTALHSREKPNQEPTAAPGNQSQSRASFKPGCPHPAGEPIDFPSQIGKIQRASRIMQGGTAAPLLGRPIDKITNIHRRDAPVPNDVPGSGSSCEAA